MSVAAGRLAGKVRLREPWPPQGPLTSRPAARLVVVVVVVACDRAPDACFTQRQTTQSPSLGRGSARRIIFSVALGVSPSLTCVWPTAAALLARRPPLPFSLCRASPLLRWRQPNGKQQQQLIDAV